MHVRFLGRTMVFRMDSIFHRYSDCEWWRRAISVNSVRETFLTLRIPPSLALCRSVTNYREHAIAKDSVWVIHVDVTPLRGTSTDYDSSSRWADLWSWESLMNGPAFTLGYASMRSNRIDQQPRWMLNLVHCPTWYCSTTCKGTDSPIKNNIR